MLIIAENMQILEVPYQQLIEQLDLNFPVKDKINIVGGKI